MSQSIERAIDVLKIVGEAPQTPSEIARRLDVHRSTALRIMDVLLAQRFLRKLSDGRYGIGPGLQLLAHQALDQFSLATIANPWLVKLSELHDQTVHLAELQNDQIVYIDKVEPKRSIRLTSRVGQSVCLHTASVAKCILASLPPATRDHLLHNHVFEKFTPTTIDSRSRLEDELLEVSARGWATDDGELEDYVNSIGAPIRDASGAVVAAVSVIELKAIGDLQVLRRDLLDALRDSAEAISAELGWERGRR